MNAKILSLLSALLLLVGARAQANTVINVSNENINEGNTPAIAFFNADAKALYDKLAVPQTYDPGDGNPPSYFKKAGSVLCIVYSTDLSDVSAYSCSIEPVDIVDGVKDVVSSPAAKADITLEFSSMSPKQSMAKFPGVHPLAQAIYEKLQVSEQSLDPEYLNFMKSVPGITCQFHKAGNGIWDCTVLIDSKVGVLK